MLVFFFFNDTATTEIYTLSLHDALPISAFAAVGGASLGPAPHRFAFSNDAAASLLNAKRDRKSTRLNSSHGYISYAAFCLKKKDSEPAALTSSRLVSIRTADRARRHDDT